MPDKNLKNAYNVAKATDSDDFLLKAVRDEFADELKFLAGIPEELYDKFIRKDINLKSPSVSTLAAEQIEEGVKTPPDATKIVMRPKFTSVEKPSHFFSDIKYNVSLDKVKVKKKLDKQNSIALVGDVFDKSVGVAHVRNKGWTLWKSGIEFEPKDCAFNLKTEFRADKQCYKAAVYLNDKNSGVNIGICRDLNKNGKIYINGSVFESDAACKIEYQAKEQDGSKTSFGVYGSTKYNELGVFFRVTTF